MTKYVVACQMIGNSWIKRGIRVNEYILGKDGVWYCKETSSFLDDASIHINYTEDNYAHCVFNNKEDAELYANGIRFGMMLASKSINGMLE